MSNKLSLDEWAQTATVPNPPHWGKLEAELVARTPAPRFGPSDLMAPLLLLLFSIPATAAWIGLALVAANAEPDLEMPDGASLGARIAFIVAIVTATVTLETWREGKRQRSVGALVATGGNAVASAIAYVLVRPATEEWLGLFTLISTVVNLGLFVAILLKSTPGSRTHLPFLVRVRTLVSPANEFHYVQARNRALELLADRDIVTIDQHTRENLLQKPLGSWHHLDRVSARQTR